MTATRTQTNRAEEQAISIVESIQEELRLLEEDFGDDLLGAEPIWERLREWPLALTIHGERPLGGEEWIATGYTILMSTGGPACRIVGSLNIDGWPADASIEYQDWGTPWTVLSAEQEQEQALLVFARQFVWEY